MERRGKCVDSAERRGKYVDSAERRGKYVGEDAIQLVRR